MNVFELCGTIAINNKGANEALKDTSQKAERTGKQIQEAFKKVGSAVMKAGKWAIGTATAITAVVETTRDYRTAMAKLDTAFTTNGHSAETAIKTYKALQAVLGDTDQAVEAANHLAVMCDTEEELANWTDICTGVYAQFGDSLPIEGLTESANETAKVGQVTGSLADALNWAGINEDDFNLKLKTCRDEQERQKLIMDTLLPLYKEQADSYKENAANIMAANEAQDNLNNAMSKLGDICEPIVTNVKNWIADMVTASIPHLESIIDSFSNFGTTWETEVWPAIQEDWKIAFNVDMPSWAEVTRKIKEGWYTVKSSIAGLFTIDAYINPTVNSYFGGGTSEGTGAGRSFAGGLDYVPMDSYVAKLHKGEAVLNKAEADAWRSGNTSGIEAKLDQLIAIMGSGSQVVLDSGAVVGQLAPAMDARLGTISNRKGRRN